MFCDGHDREWGAELFWVVVYDVRGRRGEGEGEWVAVSESGGKEEEEGKDDGEEEVVRKRRGALVFL